MTARQRGTLGAAILGSAIVFLDGTIVNIALKSIGTELPSSIVGKLEGETYLSSGTSRRWLRCSCSPARSVITTAGGGSSSSASPASA